MSLAKDPDTLRIPAFMRKRSLRASARRPLLLTALDRKQAGVLPEALQQALKFTKPKTVKVRGHKEKMPKIVMPKRQRPKIVKPKLRQTKPVETFSTPLLDTHAEMLFANRAHLAVGEITHYYDKIKVAVIKLTGTLCVGDCIRYELAEPSDDENTYEEVVESMEIDRCPVFKAGRGKEVGIKLRKKPRVESAVAIS